MDYILKEIKRKLIYFFSCLGPGGTLRLVAAVALVSALIMELRGEIGGEIGVKRNDLRDVAVYLLDESHVLDHVVWDSRLVILVHLWIRTRFRSNAVCTCRKLWFKLFQTSASPRSSAAVLVRFWWWWWRWWLEEGLDMVDSVVVVAVEEQ